MDIAKVGATYIKDRDIPTSPPSTAAPTPNTDRADLSGPAAEWRGKVRLLDEEIRTLQDRLSRAHLRQDALVDLQNELLEYDGTNFPTVRQRVERLVQSVRYNGEPLLADITLLREEDLWSLSARLEVEKNRLAEEKSALSRDLKAASIARENLILSSSGTPATPPEKALAELRSDLAELSRASYLDHSRIRNLLG